jgi:hypothetical protein
MTKATQPTDDVETRFRAALGRALAGPYVEKPKKQPKPAAPKRKGDRRSK